MVKIKINIKNAEKPNNEKDASLDLKKSRREISLDLKKQIKEYYTSNKKNDPKFAQTQVIKHFKPILGYEMPRSTLSDIIKNTAVAETQNSKDNQNSDSKTYRNRRAAYPELEEALFTWLKDKLPISDSAIIEKAKELGSSLFQATNFTFSSGWLNKFKQRYLLLGKRGRCSEIGQKSTESEKEKEMEMEMEKEKELSETITNEDHEDRPLHIIFEAGEKPQGLVSDWTSRDVKQWISSLSVSSWIVESDVFDNVNGSLLRELNEIKKNAPDSFYNIMRSKLSLKPKLTTSTSSTSSIENSNFQLSDLLKISSELSEIFNNK